MSEAGLDVGRIVRETFVRGVEHHGSIGSTNDRAAACSELPGRELPLLIVTDRQTAGRGRGGRRWWAGEGSLAFSLLLEAGPSWPDAGKPPMVSLAAGVAVAECVAPLVPSRTVGVVWPNDVFVGERKVAGILVEGLPNGRLVVGVGVNTNNTLADAPAELRDTAVTLRDLTGSRHDRTELLIALIQALERWLGRLAVEPSAVGRRFDELCLLRGKTVVIQSGAQRVRGTCSGVAPDGALLVDTGSELRTVYSGSVVSRQG